MATSGGSRVKKPCDCCRTYLDHLDEKNQTMSSFLRRMTANSKHSMIVPNRFLKHFAGKFTGTIKLESPNGIVYDVEATEHLNKMVLGCGWEAFVDVHHIEENDFLLFRHIEKSCFEVLILDSYGCEKMFSCAGIKNTPNVRERNVDSVDISSSSRCDTTESSESERSTRCVKVSYGHHRKTAKMAAPPSSSEESGQDIPSENESFESDDDDHQTPPRVDYVLSRRSYLSEAQKKRVMAFIQEIQPEIPVFVAIMHKSNVKPPCAYLVIAKEYALAHFPRGITHLTLQRPGENKKWHLRFYTRKDRRLYMLRGQWLDFVRDNHVQHGDICLLLPIKGGKKFKLMVYLLRAAATLSRGGSGIDFRRVGPCHGGSSTKMASAVHIKEESTDGEHVSSESDMNEISDESLNNKDSGGPSEPPYILPWKNCLSQSQKRIIEVKVRAIQSDVPIYVAIMRKTNIAFSRRSMLEIGAQFADAYLPSRGQTVVLHCKGKIWETKMVIHSSRRWFLSRGWPEFVHDNGLRVGDICLFELMKNERKLTMMVHIMGREQF